MYKSEIKIAGRKISSYYPPYVIAELSANHNGSLETAFKIIDKAVEAGADAIKLQILKGELITPENVKSIRPGYGMAPKNLDSILGKVALQDIKRGQAMSWSLVEK